MANGDHSHSDSQSTGVLGQDVGCPGCGYNLRGLGNDDVVCPECGLASNVATLLVRRWDKPWYRAPKYNLICLPAALVLLGLLGWVFCVAAMDATMSGSSQRMMTMAWMFGGMVCWTVGMAWVWQKMDGLASAGFALLAHISIVGYLGSLVLLLSGLSLGITSLADYLDRSRELPKVLFVGLLMVMAGIGVFVLSRWIERLVAGHCIRLYLRQPTTSG